jgi:GT2 family glycosyltransferase
MILRRPRNAAIRLIRTAFPDTYPRLRRLFAARGRLLTSLRPSVQVSALLRSHIFDADYYEAQTSEVFFSRRDAAVHFVTDGMRKGGVPHPLIEIEYFPRDIRDMYAAGDVVRFLAYLRSPAADLHAWSPLYHPPLDEERPPGMSPLQRLRTMPKDAVLPCSPRSDAGRVTLAQLRSALLANAQQVRYHQTLKSPHRFTSWDHVAEERVHREVALIEIPQGKDPVVTVVLAVWNRESLVAEAIRSVREQTLTDWELLVIDDGSSDSTPEVVAAVAAVDGRIRLIRADHGGVARARNIGIEEARGRLVAFLDSDNTWRPTFLDTMIRTMHGRELPAAFAAIKVYTGSAEPHYLGGRVTAAQLLIQNYLDLNAFIARRELLLKVGGFDPSLRRWVDHDLFIRVARHSPIEYVPIIGCDYEHREGLERISNVESPNYRFAVLGKNLAEWRADAVRVDGLVSVVIPVTDNHVAAVTAALSVLREQVDVEVILVDGASPRVVSSVLTAAFLANERVRVVRAASTYSYGILANIGAASSSGEFIFILSHEIYVREGTLAKLMTRLADQHLGVVQPVIVNSSGWVESAGYATPSSLSLPVPFLAGHPLGDATRHGGDGLTAVDGRALMMRAREFAALGGFDPIFVDSCEDLDLSARVVESGMEVAVACDSIAVKRGNPLRRGRESENRRIYTERWRPAVSQEPWARLGMRLAHLRPAPWPGQSASPVIVRDPRVDGRGRPGLRWAIRIGADFSPGGDRWGDVPFADSLAMGLRRLGQEVFVERRLFQERPMSYLDDVTLTLRGRYPIRPQPGRVNILWVISRPDLIRADELLGYDLVFAASPVWARHMEQRTRRPVHVLLQATDPLKFHMADGSGSASGDVVFVGGAREPIGRQVVADVRSTGVPVRVWGPYWDSYVEPHEFVADFISNDDVAEVYRSARLVLNDHFEDMADWGFVNNRVFDAVASGARVLSDHVSGLEELFGGAARTYRSEADLASILGDVETHFADAAQRRAIAESVAREHSFDTRAESLLSAVEQCLSDRPDSAA